MFRWGKKHESRKINLKPLSFREAVSDILKVEPEPKQKPTPKARKGKRAL